MTAFLAKASGKAYMKDKEGGIKLKKEIHPNYKKTTITCVCGEVIETHSTREDIHIEICSKCHPFFTGKQKLVDTAGRVEKFRRKYKPKTTDN